ELGAGVEGAGVVVELAAAVEVAGVLDELAAAVEVAGVVVELDAGVEAAGVVVELDAGVVGVLVAGLEGAEDGGEGAADVLPLGPNVADIELPVLETISANESCPSKLL